MFVNELKAIELLLNGEVIAAPTETVFGILALYSNNYAIEKLLNLKKRTDKHLCVYVNEDFNFNFQIPNEIKKFIPGPLTIIKNGIGYRISSNKIIQRIIKEVGPLIGTSANFSGHPPIVEAKYLNFNIPSIDSNCELGIESTVLDLDNNIILRNGYVDLSHQYESIQQSYLSYVIENNVKFSFEESGNNYFIVGLHQNCDFILNDNFNNFWSSVSEGIKKKKNINFQLNLNHNNYLENLIITYINRLLKSS